MARTHVQAKRIAWSRLKELTRLYWAAKPNESDLSVRVRGGGVIALRGADQYDSLRGHGLDFVVLDEYASMRPGCWTEVLRPALSDRRGGALFIGTPQGSNHLWERFEQAQRDPEWQAFRFSTAEAGNVAEEELASAARELDEPLYRQEFEASFESAGVGLAYHAFSRAGNVAGCEFRESEPLIWSLDFNVHPMCSVIAQRVGEMVLVLDEMILENANTPAACEAFLGRILEWMRRTPQWNRPGALEVEVYGDASGHQRRTSGTGTDWSLIREFFRVPTVPLLVRVRAAASNPSVRGRVNLMNCLNAKSRDERVVYKKLNSTER